MQAHAKNKTQVIISNLSASLKRRAQNLERRCTQTSIHGQGIHDIKLRKQDTSSMQDTTQIRYQMHYQKVRNMLRNYSIDLTKHMLNNEYIQALM